MTRLSSFVLVAILALCLATLCLGFNRGWRSGNRSGGWSRYRRWSQSGGSRRSGRLSSKPKPTYPSSGGSSAKTKLSQNDITELTSVYGLAKHPLGDFYTSPLYISPNTTVSSSGDEKPLAALYLIVVNDRCVGFFDFPEIDRIYSWIDGKAYIDLAKPDGTMESVCLGNTLKNRQCKYNVTVPAGVKSNFRATNNYIILTGTTVNGDVTGGRVVSMKDIRTNYFKKNRSLIYQLEAQYCK